MSDRDVPDSGVPAIDHDVAGVERRAVAVEGLPLVDRADAFAALHDELRTRLESGGGTRG